MMQLSLCFFSLLIFSASSLTSNETDKLSLLEIKSRISGDPLGLLPSWNDSARFCSWPGVTCGAKHGQVIALDLRSWQLSGQLSPHIGNLTFLRALNLANNSFRLGIPPEIGRLVRLRVLELANNSFGGEIPANVSGCSRLRYLSLYNNGLVGKIPNEIGELVELDTVMLGNNGLGGEIPASFGNLSSLMYLYLTRNMLQGNIPGSLGRLRRLTELALQANNLTGFIPPALYNISTIKSFKVVNNKLEGSLPANLGHTLPNLQEFLFSDNQFSGPIPLTLSNSSNLLIFEVAANRFSGKVPSFAKSSNLQRFSIPMNNLGSVENDLDFLHGFINCSDLEYINAVINDFRGPIPDIVGNMTSKKLRQITLGRNRVVGKIPSGIGNLVTLQVLSLEGNQLTGHVPNSIGKLRNLYFFSVMDNKLSGTIPYTLGNLTSMGMFFIDMNNIHGGIPESLGECKNLQAMSLAINNLSGPIPSQVLKLSSLSRVLNLSGNHLTGTIPVDVGNLGSLGILDFSENNLSGEIPKALGSCESLEYLFLSGNFFEGSIPKELDSLKGARVIDLSRNNLSGQVPTYFSDLQGLQYLNLSFNEFEGQLPIHGIFQNASKFSIDGNTRLCGGLPELKLQKCFPNIGKKRSLPLRTKVIIVCCCVVGSITILFIALIAFRLKQRGNLHVQPPSEISLPRVSYGDLSRATNGFSLENLIGVGRFGSVYKGILHDEKLPVAVKVLNLHISSAFKSFIAECETLRILRHRNLIKLQTVCSSIDVQGNDFKALVYEFMENGNLDEWLHSSLAGEEQIRSLNLVQRINIAIDVASAIEYLHNYGPQSIVHCDIKPSNILLDGDMVAHVGDFGLAKLLDDTFAHHSSSIPISSVGVRGTIGYIAPEYAMGSEASKSGDIYSYGVLLLEMFTGKRPTDGMFKDDFNLNSFASMGLPERIKEIMDPTLLEEENSNSKSGIPTVDDKNQEFYKCLISIIGIGIACSSTSPEERRNISDVGAELSRIRVSLMSLNVS